MTPRQNFIKALKREKITGLVPTFELVFFLTMEKFKKVHPCHRAYHQWMQMSKNEREAQLCDLADLYIDTAKTYDHSAIFVHPNPSDFDNTARLLEMIREKSNDEYFLMMHGDTTLAIPNGNDMVDFSVRIYEDPQSIVCEQQKNMAFYFGFAEKLSKKKGLLDGFALCSDYCFNDNPFYAPSVFADLIAPALSQTIDAYRKLGFYTIKHTDGNVNPILGQIVDCKPDAVHSLDPQAGVNLSEVKKKYGDRICLIGNVNCGLLQTGTEEQIKEDVLRSLRQGMDGFGYIFSTSNCVYTGMPLNRYEFMIELWKKHGGYP